MTINFLTITDPHHSGKGPEAYLPNPAAYKLDSLNILTECTELAREHNCSAVLIPGDVTDTHLMSDRVKTEFIEAIKKFPCPVIAIDGNHCKETTNREDLKAAPYGVLRAAGVIWDAYDNPFVSPDTSLDHGFSVTGHPYDENTDWDITQYCIKEKLAQVTIHLTHGALMPDHPWYITDKENKADREGRRHRYTTFNELYSCPSSLVPDIIVNGHLHNGHEATYLPNGTLIVNYGAVCHLSRDVGEINRVLKVGLVSIEGPRRYKARGIVLKSQRPGHECLSREKLEREIERSKNKEKMSEYLQLLGSKREIRTRDAREVIRESVEELGEAGKLPGGVAGDVVQGRCLERLDRVSNKLEGAEMGV